MIASGELVTSYPDNRGDIEEATGNNRFQRLTGFYFFY